MELPVELGLSRIQHIGIPVSQIDTSVGFYSSLGFKEAMRSPFMIPEGEGLCVMMQSGEIIIELYQLPSRLISQDILKRVDGHIDHIAFNVDDIESTFSILKNNNFQILQESPVYLPFWKNGIKFFHILGPDKERLEFNQIL